MFKKVAPDKWKHFFIGIPLGAVLQIAGWYFFPLTPLLCSAYVFMVLVLICYGFELFSKFTGKGHYEIADAVAGVAGGILGIGLTLIFLYGLWI